MVACGPCRIAEAHKSAREYYRYSFICYGCANEGADDKGGGDNSYFLSVGVFQETAEAAEFIIPRGHSAVANKAHQSF